MRDDNEPQKPPEEPVDQTGSDVDTGPGSCIKADKGLDPPSTKGDFGAPPPAPPDDVSRGGFDDLSGSSVPYGLAGDDGKLPG